MLFLQQSLHYSFAQINPKNIEIIRDTFGVPHIYGKTDAEAAYGLAWATCEDDFKSIQEQLAPTKKLLGLLQGKKGVLFDFALSFFEIDSLVEARYETDLSPDFKAVLDGYIQGLNRYAELHTKDVLAKKMFPFTAKDLIKSYTLNTTLMSGAGMALKAIKENTVHTFNQPNETGSNALAISKDITTENKSFLLINSHQPIEGRFSWYEAHVASDEGWNMIGATFPGAATLFIGSNQYLGWAHTNNYHTNGDVFLLEVSKGKYKLDGKWMSFRTKKVTLKIKILGLPISISKKLLFSVHGPVFKTKHGYYALKFPGYMSINAGEQWYRMNKAHNYAEFEKAMQMEALPLFNIIYADIEGNIFFHSGGKIACRETVAHWRQPLMGSLPENIWQKLITYEEKPMVINPSCGYVYNCNQSPYFSTHDTCNWNGPYFNGLQLFQYNRGERMGELLKNHAGKFSWTDFRDIKFDKKYCLDSTYAKKFYHAYHLDAQKYPQLKQSIALLKNWNLSGDTTNSAASLALLMHENLAQKYHQPFAMFMIQNKQVEEKDIIWSLENAQKFLLKKHGTLEVPLGAIQKHIRGNIILPASGLREVLRATDIKLYDTKKGIYRVVGGDGYMQMNKYSKQDGAEVYSIHPYGSSAVPSSKHFTDQMQLFQQEQLKKMTFNKQDIQNSAERIYNPQ